MASSADARSAAASQTTLAAALVRDSDVGTRFAKLLWVSVGQEPDLLQLLRTLHFQLTSSHLPTEARSVRDAQQLLKQAAAGVRALLVLDDCWSKRQPEVLNVVDMEAGAACVITTRIRNLGAGGGELASA